MLAKFKQGFSKGNNDKYIPYVLCLKLHHNERWCLNCKYMHTIPIWELKFSRILYVYNFVKSPWEYLHFGVWMLIIILGQYDLGCDTRENLSSVFPTKWDLNQSPQLKRLARKWKESLLVASLEMMLSNNKYTSLILLKLLFVCLILYIVQSCQDRSFWAEPVLSTW